LIDFYLKLLLFFVVSLLYFYSVSGFGKIITDKNSNYFEAYLDGTILLIILSYLIYITFGTNHIINIIITSVGLIFYFIYNKDYKNIKNKNTIFLFLSLFSILIISKTHDDFNGYHYFSIFEIFNNNLRLGVSNLNIRFFHSSLLALNQAIIILPYFDFKLVHLSTFFIYFCVIGYFITILFSKDSKSSEVFYSILCLFVMLIKFNRLSEYGYDYVAQFILLIVFHKIYFLNSSNNEIIKSIIYFLLTILIKPISLFFMPIMVFIIYKKGFFFYRKIPNSKYFLIFSLIFILFSSSFFKTGCLFYPLNKTCFSIDNVSWSEREIVEEYSEITTLWAKGFIWQENTKYKRIDNPKIYNQSFNWFKYWIELHFFYNVFEFILIVFGSIIIIHIYFTKDKSTSNKNNKDKMILILLSLSSIIFWLITLPQFRFGFSPIIIFSYLLIDYILDLRINFNKKKFFHILILGLIVLNFKNINRIHSEFERNDFYKFKNFPFYTEIEIKNDYSNLEIKKIFHIEILK
jgi:hypothetical protein